MKRIFVTGASGCIGHYVAEALIQQTDYELFLLVRDPQKLKLDLQGRSGIHLIQGNLRQIQRHQELLATVDGAVLLATAWGGAEETYDVNVTKTLQLVEFLTAGSCQQILYFSTESILDRHNNLLKEAGELGTDYIRTKFLCLQNLERLPAADRITALFPSLVFGGDDTKPKSHITAGLPEVLRWLGLARFLKADASFHFVHGADIGQVVCQLLTHPESTPAAPNRGIPKLVLGSAPLAVDDAIAQLCAYFHKPIPFRIPLSIALAEVIIKVFRIEMAPWDRFCLSYRHFTHDRPVSPASFGLPTQAATLADLMQVLQIPPTLNPKK